MSCCWGCKDENHNSGSQRAYIKDKTLIILINAIKPWMRCEEDKGSEPDSVSLTESRGAFTVALNAQS